MKVHFTKVAQKQLTDWIKSDRSTAQKIYMLIDDIQKNGLLDGLGKPELLRYYKNPPRYSRHISRSDRLVYSPVTAVKY
jgi:toxin YoeB